MQKLASHIFLFLVLFYSISIVVLQSIDKDWPTGIPGVFQTNWTGVWHGYMEAHPEGEIGNGWNVTLEIGPYPMQDETCTIWKSTFTEHGNLKAIKDYRFCRGHGAEDVYIDEGGGVTLDARWIKDVLVSSFKYKGVFAISCMRLREDTLEEEIVITEDKPGIEDRPVSVRPNSIHRMNMKRIKT